MTIKQPTSSNTSSTDVELITDPVRIVRLFEKLTRTYSPLTVKFPGSKEVFTSCTVGVSKPHLLLDELIPSTGHELLLKERRVNISGKLDGVDIQFTTTLIHVDEKNKILTYHMSLPDQIEYHQLRDYYRVNIPLSKVLRVDINNEGAILEGVLHDLSHGGAGILFPVTSNTITPGSLHECTIELPENIILKCATEMRYTQNTVSGKQLTGVRFLELNLEQSRIIGRFISGLERDLLRKRAAD